MMPTSAEYRTAANLLSMLPDLVEYATHDRGLTPAEVAQQSGVPVTTLMGIVAGDAPPSHKASVALLRWLAGGTL